MYERARLATLVAVVSCLSACAPPRPTEQRANAAPAAGALSKGDLATAKRRADAVLARDAKNPQAALVRAITRYEQAMKQASKDLRTVVIGGAMAGGLNQRYLKSALAALDAELAAVESDLALASQDPEISMELCLACWEKDWNGNGRVDARDRLLFQIEEDASGRPIPEDDPRRKPTFRFDLGDVYWARAFVAFQRAAIDVVSAYDFSDLDRLLEERATRPRRVRLRLVHPERMRSAREHILTGLGHSEQSRRAYLREHDDEREWVPNPKQKDHPLPLPVDGALYATWEGVVGDLRRLVSGQEGLGVRELAQLGDHRSENPPSGFIDVGGLFSSPQDIVIDLDLLERAERRQDVDAALKSLFGTHYRRQMKASPLPSRLARMKGEMDRGEESLERKLRYLFWIN